MKTITAISASAFLALAVPAFAQGNNAASTEGLKNNGSPNSGVNMKEPGDRGAESGRAPQEGRSSATDPAATGNMGGGGANDPGRGNMAPGGGPGDSGK